MRQTLLVIGVAILASTGCADTPPGTPQLDDNCAGNEFAINNALAEAWRLNENVLAYMNTGINKNEVPFRLYMDAKGREMYKSIVADNYGKIRVVLQGPYGVECSGADKACMSKPHVLAWVNKTTDHDHIIHLCADWWGRNPNQGHDTQGGTIEHEMSHFRDTADTQDFDCLPPACQSIAQTNPDKAVQSADNYTYLAEERPTGGCRVAGRRGGGGGGVGFLACLLCVLSIARRRPQRDTRSWRHRMSRRIWAVSFLALMPACLPANAQTRPAPITPQRLGPDPRLSCRLAAPSTVGPHDPVWLTMTLRNTTSVPLRFLPWGTPFAGREIYTEAYEVERQGARIPYAGIVACGGKYATLDDYVVIAPGASMSAAVDLRTRYDMTERGTYLIRFSHGLADLVEGNPDPESRQMASLDCVPVTITVAGPVAVGPAVARPGNVLEPR